MAKKDFDKKALEDWTKSLKAANSVQSELEGSMSKYVSAIEKLTKLSNNLKHIESVRVKQQETLSDLEKELISLLDSKIGKTKEEKKEIRNQVKEISKKIKAQKISLSISDENLGRLKKQTDEFKTQVQSVNKMNVGFNAVGKFLKSTPSLIKNGFGRLRSSGIMEMDKSIRNARLEMGLFSEQGKSFYNNIENASFETNQLGIGIEDLTKMQSQYSNEIGRSVQFTQTSAKAMAELAKGTNLGVEGASNFVSEMDNLGVSIKDTRDYVEDTVNSSHAMGLNTSKVIKNIQNNLKLANKYNFKNGIKGLAHMAQLSTKFKLDMGSVAGMADKLFDIEGAVDMSAQLQVLGGEWAKLADPFKLMYQAREDMDGLFESIVNATKGSAQFVKETGEFKLSGMELHRLKKVADATGLSYEELAQSAKQAAKFEKIKMNIKGKVDPKLEEFITSTAEYDKSKGQYQIMVGSDPKLISSLTDNDKKMLANQAKQKETLKDQAQQARNFGDEWESTINMFKIALLPLLQELNSGLTPEFKKFREKLLKGDFINTIKSFASTIGSLISNVASPLMQFAGSFPKLTTALVAGFGLSTWIAKGVALGEGFLMTTKGFGDGSMMDGLGGGLGGKMGKLGKGASFGKKAMNFGKGALKGGAMLSAISVGIDGVTNALDDNLSVTDKFLKTLDQHKGLAAGAAAGSVIPGIGTAVGAGIGGIADMFMGEAGTYGKDSKDAKQINDGVIQNGKVSAVTNEKDVMMAMKPNGPLANTIGGANTYSSNNGSKSIEIKFQPLKIEFGDINVKTPDSSFKLNLMQDKSFMNELSRGLQETLRMALNGGKLNPNPIS